MSNFNEAHIEAIKAAGMKVPEVNQIEIHPLCTQEPLIAYCKANKILPIAYSSLAPTASWRVDPGQASSKTETETQGAALLESLAAKYQISQAQCLLKWALQKGYPILPKSSKLERIQENACLFHFTLEEADIAGLDALNEDKPYAWPIGNVLMDDVIEAVKTK